jgi:hypothetical protein
MRYKLYPLRRLVKNYTLPVIIGIIALLVISYLAFLFVAHIVERVGEHSVQGAPTITAAKIDQVLCNAGSPACGKGQVIYDDGVAAGINPAYALAFFQHESTFGTAGVARSTHSIGNLRCIKSVPCVGGYAYFRTWEQGIQAWYDLINSSIYIGSGHTTVESIIPIYAPASDHNDEQAYIQSVVSAVQSWAN